MISTFTDHSSPHDPLDAEPAEPAAAELFSLARRIEDWRVARDLSLSQLCRHITGINHKTHQRILSGAMDGITPENHLTKYRAACIEADAFDQRQGADPILPDLTPTRVVRDAINSLKLQQDIDRFLLVEGESGAGKSSALASASASDADAMLLPAHEGWGRPLLAVTELLSASGFRGTLPNGFSERHAALIRRLQDKPRLILVDEGQHMEIRILNVLKDVINRTGCWVVIGTMASLWQKIQARHWPEVKQLLHNRMHLRVTLQPPDSADVEMFLTSRLSLKLPEEKCEEGTRWQRAFDGVASEARSHGGFAYCRKVANAARLLSLKNTPPGITPANLLAAAGMISANTKGYDRC